MERTAEFYSLVDESREELKLKKLFYEEMYENVQGIISRTEGSVSYRTLLGLERELDVMMKKSTTVLDGLNVAGTEDLRKHFEGVKQIINKRFVDAMKAMADRKRKIVSPEVELEPERPTTFKKVAENQLLELESKNMVESAQYEMTKQRLMKIEAVQKAIHENLVLQDERIDSICATHGTTSDIYRAIKTEINIDTGSFFKRAGATIILCLAFVLVFVHVFYR